MGAGRGGEGGGGGGGELKPQVVYTYAILIQATSQLVESRGGHYTQVPPCNQATSV